MMLESDYILDIVQLAGRHYGHIVSELDRQTYLKGDSVTSQYMSVKLKIQLSKERRMGNGEKIKLTHASGNNLKNVDLQIPLGTFTCITGVSGSGKSTLIHETL